MQDFPTPSLEYHVYLILLPVLLCNYSQYSLKIKFLFFMSADFTSQTQRLLMNINKKIYLNW